MIRKLSYPFTALLAAVCLLQPSCDRLRGQRTTGVILLVMDTVRADHLSTYGYDRRTSPNLTALAERATLYERAVSTASWTVPSHASIFTGKDPCEHGAHFYEPETGARFSNINPLPDRHTTLAEWLGGKGCSTTAFVANQGYLSPRWQLDQGFQIYHTQLTTGEVLNRHVYEWMDTLSTDRFFLFVNYMDAHDPYNVRPVEGFTEKPVTDNFRLRGQLKRAIIEEMRGGHVRMDIETLRSIVIEQYDTGIANVDQAVGALIDSLEARGLYDQTAIIVTSDHGELFGEHGYLGHSKDVYHAVLNVPLIVKAPGQTKGRRESTPTTLASLPRMILSMMERDIEKGADEYFPGRKKKSPFIAEQYFTSPGNLQNRWYGDKLRRIRRAVYDWPHKLIRSTDGEHELYNLDVDIGESDDLFARDQKTAARLSRWLEDHVAERAQADLEAVEQAPLTDDEIETLRTLGYIGNELEGDSLATDD